jgi:DNA-binding phage protein
MVLAISIFIQSFAYAEKVPTCQSYTKDICRPLNPQQEIAADMCRIEMKDAKCDDFFKNHPELGREKQRDCDQLASCSESQKLADYTKACLENWGGAWGDMITGLYEILAGDIKMSANTKAREEYFAKCTTPACKREMLGPYADLFKKEEIEGHADNKNLDPKDPANQNYLQGLSAKVLYKKLLERISQKIKEGTLDQPVLEPWSGKAAKPLKSVNEMIENTLLKMGLKNTTCYNPVALSEMRCYALFTVLDPLMFVSAAGKVASLAGKGLEKAAVKEGLLAKAELGSKVESPAMVAKKLDALKAHNNPRIDAGIANVYEKDKKYIQRANENSDSTIEFWKDHGVTIKDDGRISLNSAEMGQKISNTVDSMVDSGVLKESETLRPVLLYRTKDKMITVSPNEVPPAGAVRIEGLVDNNKFYELIADGKFPMGMDEPTYFSTYSHAEPAFLHDAGHFEGFINNPEFMAATRKAAQKIRETKNPEVREVLENRFFFAGELSQAFAKKDIAAATSDLGDIKKQLGLSSKTPLSHKDYYKALNKLSEAEVDKLYNDIPKTSLFTARPDALGGAEHQIQHRYPDKSYDTKWPFESRGYTNHPSSEETRIRVPISDETRKVEQAGRLSVMLEKADAFIRIRPEDWMTEGTSGAKLPRNGNTTILCKSKDAMSTMFWRIYCQGQN